jgi:hypothetical protein
VRGDRAVLDLVRLRGAALRAARTIYRGELEHELREERGLLGQRVARAAETKSDLFHSSMVCECLPSRSRKRSSHWNERARMSVIEMPGEDGYRARADWESARLATQSRRADASGSPHGPSTSAHRARAWPKPVDAWQLVTIVTTDPIVMLGTGSRVGAASFSPHSMGLLEE